MSILAFLLSFLPQTFAADPAAMEKQISKMNPGWKVEETAVGDLSGDKHDDIAVILSKQQTKKAGQEDDDIETETVLKVFFSDSKGKLSPKVEARKAVCFRCGGVNGAEIPFTLSIDTGVLNLSYEGGSRWAHSTETKWRFQKGDFYLIGIRSFAYDKSGNEKGLLISIKRDANVSTLKMTEALEYVVKESPEGEERIAETKSKECSVPKSFQEIKLSAYSDEFSEPKCSNAAM